MAAQYRAEAYSAGNRTSVADNSRQGHPTMVFNRLFRRLFHNESAGIPTFYPDLDPAQLEQFLTDQDYARIRSFDNVYILPFFSQKSESRDVCLGVGLSRL